MPNNNCVLQGWKQERLSNIIEQSSNTFHLGLPLSGAHVFNTQTQKTLTSLTHMAQLLQDRIRSPLLEANGILTKFKDADAATQALIINAGNVIDDLVNGIKKLLVETLGQPHSAKRSNSIELIRFYLRGAELFSSIAKTIVDNKSDIPPTGLLADFGAS